MVTRRVFYSFHYDQDVWRVSQIRNIGEIEDNKPVKDNDWEAIKRGGNDAIRNWINAQLKGRSATIVLIGWGTAGRYWIDYEIKESWNKGMGLLGIHIYKLLDQQKLPSPVGQNPFSLIKMDNGLTMDRYVRVYDPPGLTGSDAYNWIKDNLSQMVEIAIEEANQR